MTNMEMNPETGAYREVQVPEHLVPSFALQRQPSKWSCIPTAFAMVMQVPAEDIVESIGHDDARGFHAQEVLSVALGLGWMFSEHLVDPEVESPPCRNKACYRGQVEEWDHLHESYNMECRSCHGTGKWLLEPKVTPLSDLLQKWNGVLVGEAPTKGLHAVAWCSKIKKCLDPVGTMYGIEQFTPHSFWVAMKFK